MQSSPEAKLAARNLNLYYGSFHALKDVNLDVQPRSITAIIGPSGCGKSTLLRTFNRMNDLVQGARVEGEVTLDGQNIYAREISLVTLRKRVGMVFQRPNPFPFSVRENVLFGPHAHGIVGRDHLEELLERSLKGAGLWDQVADKLDMPALDLSIGEQQQLCIARLLAVEPEVILLDEPCSALDPYSTLHIEDLMRALSETYTIAIVTHNMQQAARASDRAVFMLLGELVEEGPTAQVFTAPTDERTEQYIMGRFG
ncbi:MAG: phosphate ABC transporter ATP-binding protein [Armatimonadetes bacterium]|jgi:phosphate transport system ATP-binding protein|nr:phosphate ABC transporter ATP-binding protein [Armatimonadota bacterium]MDI9586659.1 phosphate ABC transporter ATP-binding protein PstB [Acidobacteriota bacterium]